MNCLLLLASASILLIFIFILLFYSSRFLLTFTVDSLFDKRSLCLVSSSSKHINKNLFPVDLIIWWGLTDLCLIYKPRDRCTINPSTSDPDSFIIPVKRRAKSKKERPEIFLCVSARRRIYEKKKGRMRGEKKKKKTSSLISACMLLLPAGWREKENERARVSLKCTSHMRRLGNSISSSQGERCMSEQIKGKKFITKQTETQEIKQEPKRKRVHKKREFPCRRM